MTINRALALIAVFWFASIPPGSCNELETRQSIAQKVRYWFYAEQFDQLESVAESYRNSQSETDSGLSKLTIFYFAFDRIADITRKDPEFWVKINSLVDQWIEEFPNSATAKLVKGIVLKQNAWKIRGGGFAHTVPEESWDPFYQELNVANEYLKSISYISKDNPHWYVVKTVVLNALSYPSEEIMEIVKEGLDKYPFYYQLYFSALDVLAPKWGGSAKDIEDFARMAVERTYDNSGMSMYARIYWYASQLQYDDRLFHESHVVWDDMKIGIYDVIEDYPDTWNVQNFAYFACLVGDKEAARDLMTRIHEQPIIRVWKSMNAFFECYSFATSETDQLSVDFKRYAPISLLFLLTLLLSLSLFKRFK